MFKFRNSDNQHAVIWSSAFEVYFYLHKTFKTAFKISVFQADFSVAQCACHGISTLADVLMVAKLD